MTDGAGAVETIAGDGIVCVAKSPPDSDAIGGPLVRRAEEGGAPPPPPPTGCWTVRPGSDLSGTTVGLAAAGAGAYDGTPGVRPADGSVVAVATVLLAIAAAARAIVCS